MMAPSSDSTAADGGGAALADSRSILASTETRLVTLPQELILDIIDLCGNSHRQRSSWERSYTRINLSSVNKLLRSLSMPTVFKSMRVYTNEDKLQGRLQAIEGNATILQAVRFLSLSTDGPDRPPCRWDFLHNDPGSNPCEADTPALLAEVLGKMTNLEEVYLCFRYGNKSLVAPLRKELAEKKIVMPSVKLLKYPSSTSVKFIPAVFHNLRVLQLEIKISPKKTAGLRVIAPQLNLDTLELSKMGWRLEDVAEIPELFPTIPRLLVEGELKATRVSALIHIFAQFSDLRYLALTEEPVVYPRPGLMDSGLMEEIEELRENDPLREDKETNALTFFQQCPQLTTVSLCRDFEANVFRPVKQDNEVVGVEVAIEYDDNGHDGGWPAISKNF